MSFVLVAVGFGCGRVNFDDQSAYDGDGDALGDGLGGDGDPSSVDYCLRIPALGAAPSIDGVLEPGVATRRLEPTGWTSRVTPLPPVPDVEVLYALGWRPDGLYFFVDIGDPDRFPSTQLSWCGDGPELYVDSDGMYPAAPGFEPIGTRQLIARAPADNTTPRSEGDIWNEAILLTAWTNGFTVVPRPGGYRLEAMIDADQVGLAQWSLSAGGKVGFDLGVNLSRSDGAVLPISDCSQNRRLGQFFLRIDDSQPTGFGEPSNVPTAFCTATLE